MKEAVSYPVSWWGIVSQQGELLAASPNYNQLRDQAMSIGGRIVRVFHIATEELE